LTNELRLHPFTNENILDAVKNPPAEGQCHAAIDPWPRGFAIPWTTYASFCPRDVHLWQNEPAECLHGTTLAPAVEAKTKSLQREFEAVCAAMARLPAWKFTLNPSSSSNCRRSDMPSAVDWARLDAWFRSRSLEIPGAGTCLVPVLDMINHAAAPNSSYEVTPEGVHLVLRPGFTLDVGDEVTISYGADKSSAEMLFNYGFFEDRAQTSMVLPVMSMTMDDPLAEPKMRVFAARPLLTLNLDAGSDLEWSCPFAYLAVLNYEDGLSFRIDRSRDVDGGSADALRLLWGGDDGQDVTDRAGDFETIVRGHELAPLFALRVVAALESILQGQLAQLEDAGNEPYSPSDSQLDAQRKAWADKLRREQTALVRAGIEVFGREMQALLEDKTVQVYLAACQGEHVVGEEDGDVGTTNCDDGEQD
jgi:hypothetical protein